jgi:4-aminobutyrate aminotransferase-like enzyme/Ser/Thr protein kinase RdoA (MazF antagonist)
LLALRCSPPNFGVAEGERIARDIYGLAVSASPLPGERDCNFRVRTADGRAFVLKILEFAGDSDSIDCLVRVLGHIAEQDATLPVPRLFPTEHGAEIGRLTRDGVEYATCLFSFLAGDLLADATPDADLLKHVGGELARLDFALQGFFHPTLNRRLAWDVRRLPELVEYSSHIESLELRRIVEACASEMRAALPKIRSLRSQAIHGDCHAGNLLVSADNAAVSGILDFGDMIHAPLILEAAVTMSELLTEAVTPLDTIGSVLQGYANAQALRPAEVDALFELITARHAVTILLHAWRAEHDAEGAKLLTVAAAHAGRSLEQLMSLDRAALARSWHAAAGTAPSRTYVTTTPGAILERRHRLMGAGAELFYEKPLHLVRGSGVWLYDAQDHAYLDVYNNVPHVGHTHPAVVSAIQKQTAILATHTRYLHESILEYAKQLTSHFPAHLNACIFVNSGSEANDVAWRMAKMASGHLGALVMDTAYHGITDAVASLTPQVGRPHDPRVFMLASPPTGLRAGDVMSAAQLSAAVSDVDDAIASLAERGVAPAAFYIDTAITSSGIFDPPAAWAKTVEARVRAAGALIVADEVQYGLGRSGSHWWGFERRGLTPDIVTMGKPVGNGYPMGVVVANRALIEEFQARFGFFSTFGGNAVAAAAGLAVLEVIEREGLLANAQLTGDYLRQQLDSLAVRHPCLGEVRGAGLLLGMQVLGRDRAAAKRNTKQIINALSSQSRILIGYEGPHTDILKLRPPMSFRREHADLLVQAIDTAAAAVEV